MKLFLMLAVAMALTAAVIVCRTTEIDKGQGCGCDRSSCESNVLRSCACCESTGQGQAESSQPAGCVCANSIAVDAASSQTCQPSGEAAECEEPEFLRDTEEYPLFLRCPQRQRGCGSREDQPIQRIDNRSAGVGIRRPDPSTYPRPPAQCACASPAMDEQSARSGGCGGQHHRFMAERI